MRPLLFQGSEPSYLERAEQLHGVMCSTLEKVGGERPQNGGGEGPKMGAGAQDGGLSGGKGGRGPGPGLEGMCPRPTPRHGPWGRWPSVPASPRCLPVGCLRPPPALSIPPPLPQSVLGGQDQLRIRVAELEDEVRNLRKINRDLFDFSTRIITRPAK